jgi:hypothetical protein
VSEDGYYSIAEEGEDGVKPPRLFRDLILNSYQNEISHTVDYLQQAVF